MGGVTSFFVFLIEKNNTTILIQSDAISLEKQYRIKITKFEYANKQKRQSVF